MRHQDLVSSDLLISALDLLLLFLVMAFLALMGVRYDADKGLGKEEIAIIRDFSQKDKDVLANQTRGFQALVLDKISVKLYSFDKGYPRPVGTFQSAQELFSSGRININLPCILYEKEISPAFADIIRTLIANRVEVGIAQAAKRG